ncbi:GD14216, partial [Drosophila simulans]
ASECRMRECGSNHALLTAKEAISLWVLGARKVCNIPNKTTPTPPPKNNQPY